MKTTVLFRMMVLVAMVVAGIANTELKAQDNNFITNEEKVDDLVVSKVIYRLDGSLYRHMKYDFTYDDCYNFNITYMLYFLINFRFRLYLFHFFSYFDTPMWER